MQEVNIKILKLKQYINKILFETRNAEKRKLINILKKRYLFKERKMELIGIG